MNSHVDAAEQNFHWLQAVEATNNFHGQKILSLIESGKIAWNDLSFNESDLKHKIRAATIRRAEQCFILIKAFESTAYSDEIRSLIKSGEINWSELSFTESDLKRVTLSVLTGNQIAMLMVK